MKMLANLILVVFLLPVAGFAQDNPLDAFIEKYKDLPGFHFFDVNTNMMSDEPGKVINLKMLSFDEKENTGFKAGKLYDEFFETFDKSAYKGLVQIKSSGDNVEMMVKKAGEMLSEIIIAVNGETETVLIAATGDITMKDLGKFSDLENCKGL